MEQRQSFCKQLIQKHITKQHIYMWIMQKYITPLQISEDIAEACYNTTHPCEGDAQANYNTTYPYEESGKFIMNIIIDRKKCLSEITIASVYPKHNLVELTRASPIKREKKRKGLYQPESSVQK